VVTIAAVASALVAISSLIGYALGVEVTRIGSDGIEQGEHQAPILSVIAVRFDRPVTGISNRWTNGRSG